MNSLHQRIKDFWNDSLKTLEEQAKDPDFQKSLLPEDKEINSKEIELQKQLMKTIDGQFVTRACMQIERDLEIKESSLYGVLSKKEYEWETSRKLYRDGRERFFLGNIAIPRKVSCVGLRMMLSECLLWALIDQRESISFEKYWEHLRQESLSNVAAITIEMAPAGDGRLISGFEMGELARTIRALSSSIELHILHAKPYRFIAMINDCESLAILIREIISDLKKGGKKQPYKLVFEKLSFLSSESKHKEGFGSLCSAMSWKGVKRGEYKTLFSIVQRQHDARRELNKWLDRHAPESKTEQKRINTE